ncbi:MAG: 8-oxoguanine DNA glycosylase [Clostridia bacterium]|nr:8-oxoguanine DNA glycosylase [Clostridia bacterium]
MSSKGIIVFNDITDFDPDQIFDCGQCFRWEKLSSVDLAENSLWSGIAGGRRATVAFINGELRVEDSMLEESLCTKAEARKFWHHYFDLDRDYGAIKRKLSLGDAVMKAAIKEGGGIRILNQDPWETLISFIISQNNNIPRIKGCIRALAETLGENGNLPSPEVLAKASREDLAPCRLGYRDRYLIEAAGQFLEWGVPESVDDLLKFSGVGPKVANCIALFGLGNIDSFPIDVWMRRVMNSLYGIAENDTKEMAAFAREHFAPYGGIAQQYLFYYITHKTVDKPL